MAAERKLSSAVKFQGFCVSSDYLNQRREDHARKTHGAKKKVFVIFARDE